MIGHKRLFYAIDFADDTRRATRKKVTDFFKDSLGFLQSEIEFIDRNKLKNQDNLYWTEFTDAE